jgi:lantibiotic biosynthesis protein
MPATTTLLRALVDYFEAVAERIGAQVRWRMANPEEAVRFAGGTFALGPAHGAAGALAALAGIAAAGVEVERARALIDGTLAWLASQRREGASAFTSYAGDTESWPGWCSGDPGIAGTLDAAGRALARPDVVDLALTTGHSMVRSVATAELGASLCHGWAGVAHICSRLHHATANADFAGAARAAFARLLTVDDDGDDSLLTGSAGVGLALLSATTSTEPRWDRALYLSYA